MRFASAAPEGDSQVYLPILKRQTLPTSPPEEDSWVAHLNYYRSLAELPPVSENPEWSSGNWFHARYSVKNNQLQHSENPGNPWYTPQGDLAAQSSNLFGSFNTYEDDSYAIAWWVSGPFHAIGLLNPELKESGYGSYREADGGLTMSAGVDTLRGLGPVPPSVSFPIYWPGDGALIHLTQYAGETPDPLTSCPGYGHPAGLPIMLQLGSGNKTPQVSSTSLLENGVPVEHCTFDETNYSNPNSGLQSLGRVLLNGGDAVVVLPRNPLTPGALYTVSITESGTTHTWSFRVDWEASGLENPEGVNP
ncbi:MAG: CAP domain-containing protein [Anaerolineales bacterium]|nr:CAP domain-containing protein [Anaerolineales bacterium]